LIPVYEEVAVSFFGPITAVLIFLFLKSFGKNEFDVPVLFADSVTVPTACTAYSL
jgi:hypothetical protein